MTKDRGRTWTREQINTLQFMVAYHKACGLIVAYRHIIVR